ncbi:DUF2185 domain-containing protein [Ascidiimonas sp. W6]|uniref:immunity protein Imm33 domain-containing protein n=1 Tax=Ascidiimonas meishanensis TaxID=3128903 RepID=UPI0030EDA435
MKKKTQILKNYFEFIESKILSVEVDTEIIEEIKKNLKEGYEFIKNHEWEIAFENLSAVLVEHSIILDKKGIEIAKEIIKECGLDKKWEFDLRRINSLGYTTNSWKLIDAEELAKEYKYTFYKPSKEITQKLKIGNLVKLIFYFESINEEHPSAERMWVKITKINDNQFAGTLDNHPFYIHELQAGDIINFEHKHIIDHDLGISEPNLADKYFDRCFATNKILYENAPINYFYREKPLEKDEKKDYIDTGWRFLSGDESKEYMSNLDNISLVSIGAVLSNDDSFIHLLESEIGTSFERNEQGEFEKIEE